MNKLKVMTVLGTRPEIIRLSRVICALDDAVDHKLVHTGQNYDYELNEVFFEELGLRKPDFFLGVETSSLGAVLGNILIEVEKVFAAEKPDAVLILGDTNSSIAGVIAKRMKIPLYHMEAGNRSFDANVPEETNRRIIDHTSDFNLVYTEHARRHLLSEGIPHRKIYLSGSPMKEVLDHYMSGIDGSNIISELGLHERNYFVVSIHREENVDNLENLKEILGSLNAICEKWNMPVIVSTHPRTRNRLDSLSGFAIDDRIHFSKPFGFFAYNKLQKEAYCVISDSGTICEESSIMGFSAITVRNSMERPEGLDAGTILITGLNRDIILQSIELVTKQRMQKVAAKIPFEYLIDNCSYRVVNLILGTAKLCHRWNGVVLHDFNIK